MAVVRTFLIGCAVLMVVGCAGVRSGAEKEEQARSEATEEQRRSPEAPATEEARCGGTRTVDLLPRSVSASVADSSIQPGDPEARFTTNDVPGCAEGGPLSGTDEADRLAGRDGEDEVRGLRGSDLLTGGYGSDVLYGGPGDDELQAGGYPPLELTVDRSKNVLHGGLGKDFLSGGGGGDVLYGEERDDEMLWGGGGEDVLYGGDGNDYLDGSDGGHRDRISCGEGKDRYFADKADYVSSSCEVNWRNAQPPTSTSSAETATPGSAPLDY